MKKEFMTLSIITPTYNQGQYISQTIESIISQEGNFFIDYIIVNDGSTDNTISIIEKYDKLLKNKAWPIKCLGISYRFINRPNGGQTSAINQGLRMVNGYACAWMNSDDYYLPGAFEAITKAFEENPNIDFIYADCLKVFEDGRPSTIEPRPRPNETFESICTRGSSFSLNFFTKRIVDRIGFLDESLQYCVDLDQWFRIFKVAQSKYIPVTIGAFRLWSGSKTTTKQNKFAEERKILAKRYGGNIISARKIYKLRGKIKILNNFQNNFPQTYNLIKKNFYRAIDLFKYRKKI